MEPLSLRYKELQDVAQDLDLVIQSTTGDEWSWQAADSRSDKWDEFVQSSDNDTTSADLKGLSGSVSVSPDVALCFTLSSAVDPIHALVEISAPTRAMAYVKGLKEALTTRTSEWDEQGVSSLFFFELVTAAQTYIADHPGSESNDFEGQASGHASNTAVRQDDGVEQKEVRLMRAIFWSHHLKAPSKLKDFNNWCPELDLWGILLTGWPGYLCFEGPKESVEEMIRRVKRLQWHAIQLRLEDYWIFTPGTEASGKTGLNQFGEALLSCPFAKAHPSNTAAQDDDGAKGKVRTGCQVLHEIGEMVARLQACGMEDDIVTQVLGLRKRRSQE